MQKLPFSLDMEQLFHICHRLFDTPASITYCVLDQMPCSSHHFNSSQSQKCVCIWTRKYRLTNPTKYSEVFDNLLVCAPGVDRGFTSFLVLKSFKGDLTQLQKNPCTCGHVKMLSPFHSPTPSL